MKKISLLLCLVLVVGMLAGCGSKSDKGTVGVIGSVGSDGATSGGDATTTKSTTEDENSDVTISISKDSVVDTEEFIQGMKKFGAEVENKESSDSFKFTFTASEYKKLLEAKHKECVKAFKELEKKEDHYVEKIEYDDNFRNLKISVNKELYDASTKTDDYIIAACALAYQLYITENSYTKVTVVYSGSDEVISSFSLPLNYNVK